MCSKQSIQDIFDNFKGSKQKGLKAASCQIPFSHALTALRFQSTYLGWPKQAKIVLTKNRNSRIKTSPKAVHELLLGPNKSH